MSFLNRCAIVGIRVYQVLVSPHLGRLGILCRHCPTCSQYGILAYQKHGFFTASLLTWQRFWDCHPRGRRPFIDFP